MKKIGVLLSGCGVYDGSEIHEAVFTLLAIEELGHSYTCIAPDDNQLHTINHLTGEVMNESRNILVEAARIARGSIQALSSFDSNEIDALVIPGGFGAAKNLNQWAISGPKGDIRPDVTSLIIQLIQQKKPIAALCMGPTVIAKAIENTYSATLTVGNTTDPSPYDIQGISEGITSTGSHVEFKGIHEICIDKKLKIVSAPCYMMQASISDVRKNIMQAMVALDQFID